MIIKSILEDKKGVSEMVSYVLLIVIAMSIAGGVYSWLKFYVNVDKSAIQCNEDVALFIEDYNCQGLGNERYINITVKNQGNFNIEGFFIRATNSSDSKRLPTDKLDAVGTYDPMINKNGLYFFQETGLGPTESKVLQFNYTKIKTIARIQVQPFKIDRAKNNSLVLCQTIPDITLDACGANLPAPPAWPAGLVGYWAFDTDFVDSVNGLGGEKQGDAELVEDDERSKVLSLDGNRDYVSVADDNLLDFGTDDFTISFWIKTTDDKDQVVLDKWDTINNDKAWRIYFKKSINQLVFKLYGKELNLGTLSKNQWYNLTIGKNGNNAFGSLNNVDISGGANFFE